MYKASMFVSLVMVLLMAKLYWVSLVSGMPMSDMTRDIAMVAGISPLTGWLSQLTMMMWVFVAAMGIVAGCFVIGRGRAYLLALGGWCLMMGLDDGLLWHDDILPRFGVNEMVVVTGYLVILLAVLWKYKKQVVSSPYYLLLGAGAMFGVSIGIDWLNLNDQWMMALEDVGKLAGILYLGLYIFEYAKKLIRDTQTGFSTDLPPKST